MDMHHPMAASLTPHPVPADRLTGSAFKMPQHQAAVDTKSCLYQTDIEPDSQAPQDGATHFVGDRIR